MSQYSSMGQLPSEVALSSDEEDSMPKLDPDASQEEKEARMKDEMEKYKYGKLRSGSKKGRLVKSRKQAVAIGLSESGQSKKRSGYRARKMARS
jgi:hypothetical protein